VGTTVRCPLLRTYREAREETLKWKENCNLSDRPGSVKIYARLAGDILCLNGSKWSDPPTKVTAYNTTISRLCKEGQFAALRSLAINITDWYGDER
jgi:hypothetical protein